MGKITTEKKIKYILIIILLTQLPFSWIQFQRLIFWDVWDIWIPRPNKIETIYQYDGFDGINIEIWHYSKSKLNQIANRKDSIKITQSTKKEIQEKIDIFYNHLIEKEKSVFDKHISINDIIVEGSYYIFKRQKEDERNTLILLIDYQKSCVYILECFY